MKVEDFKKDSYYEINVNNAGYYFRFEKYDNECIYSYGWEIRFSLNIKIRYYEENNFLCAIDSLYIIDEIREVGLSEIINYLPLGHPDRILYRKKRIEKLLYSK